MVLTFGNRNQQEQSLQLVFTAGVLQKQNSGVLIEFPSEQVFFFRQPHLPVKHPVLHLYPFFRQLHSSAFFAVPLN